MQKLINAEPGGLLGRQSSLGRSFETKRKNMEKPTKEKVPEQNFSDSGDWTVFLGNECPPELALRGDQREFHAFFNRRIDSSGFVFEYSARILGKANEGMFSDLSCHLGPVRFCFGSAKNTFTGIQGPHESSTFPGAPLISPGKWHRVLISVEDCDCRLQIDGIEAGRVELSEALADPVLKLYCWSGPCEFRIEQLRSAGQMSFVKGAPWIVEKQRLWNMQQSIQWIEHKGKFLHECGLQGEGRDCGVYPAHPNGIQLSKDRFLILYSTRAYRGDDDEKSGVYQVRADAFDGPLLKEGWICRTRDDWDLFGDGKKYVRQHGHPTAFGLPKGAIVNGRRQAHENLFAVLWRVEARWIDPETGFMAYVQDNPELTRRSRTSEWMQFRLNDAGDDIEILQPPSPLRQAGYENGLAFCQHEAARSIVANFVQPVAYNAAATEWVHADTLYIPGPGGSTNHESIQVHVEGAVVPLRFRYDPDTHRYQWVETGPPLGGFGRGLFEGSIIPYRGDWVVMARRVQGDAVAFGRTNDLFGDSIPMALAKDQPNRVPIMAYMCPDGILRRTGGIPGLCAHANGRNPLYIMDIDPENGFEYRNPRVVFDANHAGVPIPQVIVDFGKLLPHSGGKTQWILHRLRSPMLNDPNRPERKLTAPEIEASGIYAAKIHYQEEWPGVWSF